MYTENTLDRLTKDSVSVVTQKFFKDGDDIYPMGLPHRKAYVNSVEGRKELQADLEQNEVDAVFAIWGTKPTIVEEQIEL